jgi:hypothetical protein
MSKFFSDYHEAHRYAEERARLLHLDFGIEGARGYTVKMLPRPENRQGWELRCEVVSATPR